MGGSERRQQKKREDKARRRKERPASERGVAAATREPFREGKDSYAEEYRRVCREAIGEHPSLLKVIECDDGVFYDLDTNAKLRHFGLGGYSEVIFNTVDEIDFKSDPSTSESGQVNAIKQRSAGVGVTGYTSAIQGPASRRTIVFMRKETGTDNSPDVKAGVKLGALLHELGHVDDHEHEINWKGGTVHLVDAEVYAHHYACRRLMRGGYSLVLGYYLDGIQEMATSPSEYVRIAATRVLESPEWAKYRAAVSPRYGGSK